MKKDFRIASFCVIFAGSLLLAGCFGVTQENQEQGNNKTEITSEKVVEPVTTAEKKVNGGTLQYPVVNTGNKMVSEAINADIDAFIEKEAAKRIANFRLLTNGLKYTSTHAEHTPFHFLNK